MASLPIEPAVEADLEDIFQIEKREMHPDFYPRFFFKQAMSIFGNCFIVAHGDNGPAGYIIAGDIVDEPSVSEIYSVVVDSTYRRRGYGRQLIQEVSLQLTKRGFKKIRLSVSPNNKVAINLYKSLGFSKVGFEVEYFGRNEDRDIMEKSLVQ